ncbi:MULTISPECIES: HEAT repeat domain-containing protein [unclassified Microcoleus]|uniref:HEAT repeat domain-containing protein n=1 Tax=unclassified Microcoleus TaxID=2642155 RepID=UPI002FD31072
MIQNPAYYQMVLDTFCTALEDARPAVRAKAAEALGKIGDVAIAPILVKALKDTSPEVRSSVIQALGQLILNEA